MDRRRGNLPRRRRRSAQLRAGRPARLGDVDVDFPAEGYLTYRSEVGFTGADSFTFTASDGRRRRPGHGRARRDGEQATGLRNADRRGRADVETPLWSSDRSSDAEFDPLDFTIVSALRTGR